MEKGVLFYYDKNKDKIPVAFLKDCEDILHQELRNKFIRVTDAKTGEEQEIKRMDLFKQKKLYLMYQGTAFLIKDK